MAHYDSLAEQMESDFKAVMLAFTGMNRDTKQMKRQVGALARLTQELASHTKVLAENVSGLSEDLDTAKGTLIQYGRTIRRILDVERSHGARLDQIEKRLDKLDPPAA